MHTFIGPFFLAIAATAANAAPLPLVGGDGICEPAEALAGLCFVTSQGFVVEAVTGPNGEFPVINGVGNSVFAYRITGPGVAGGSCQGVSDISHGSILLPASCFGTAPTIVDAGPAPELQTNGQGDPSCGFGVGDLDNDLLKWDAGVPCDGFAEFVVVIAGEVPAQTTSFGIKAGQICESATILGPGCSNIVRYCPPTANSTGEPAIIEYDGSFSLSANQFILSASGLPPGVPGIFFFGTGQTSVPFGNGTRCVGNTQRLVKIPAATAAGTLAVQLDTTTPPLSSIVPGIPYYFQLYYRDPMGGGAGFNTTDALCIVFTP